MSALLVHPSRGKKDGQLNAGISLLRPVRLDAAAAHLLTSDESLELRKRHGDSARFWGTYRHNLKKYQRVTEGDPVLFTGGGGIWAVGRIGFQFKNRQFAQALWHSHPEKGVYEYVYSVVDYRPVNVDYEVVNAALGHKPSNHFQAMASYVDAKADAVIEALRL